MDETAGHIDFIVGAEKRIAEIVSRAEMEPLLRSLVKAGSIYAAVLDEDGLPICRHGKGAPLPECHEIRHSLLVEGEPKGALLVTFAAGCVGHAEPLALLARDALQLIVTNNLKRMLTTELHTSVVQESYNQLIESSGLLAESEKSYRELALSLEQKVVERTAELQQAYARVLQQEKLAAVGTLAAGMAHEINNPNGFIRSNLVTFRRYFERMRDMINYYQLLIADNTPLIQLRQEADKRRRELKLDFIFADTIELLAQSADGTDRIAAIVSDLKNFSHVDETAVSDADLNEELKRAIAVLKPRISPETVIVSDLQPLPLFRCHPGLISQAFFNVLQNALLSRHDGLELRIATRYADNDKHIEITVSDNGCGIAAENLSRVFDPFFTTRAVGSGTGMGLTVAREIFNEAGGTITVSSKEGAWTCVLIRLPYTEN